MQALVGSKVEREREESEESEEREERRDKRAKREKRDRVAYLLPNQPSTNALFSLESSQKRIASSL